MTRPTEIGFKTTDIDLSAAIMTDSGSRPTAQPGRDLIEFSFFDDEAVRKTALAYASGNLQQNVKKFAANRAFLYRLAREVTRSGGAR